MTEYQKTYIELKKQFVATNEGPDNVRALYTFKEELEQSEDQQAKEVLVDVYDLLDFKKDAYELLCQIGNRSDKKTLKRLGTLKDYAAKGIIWMYRKITDELGNGDLWQKDIFS